MTEEFKGNECPFLVVGVCDGKEGMHAGHLVKEDAEAHAADCNSRAAELGIKTRYKVIAGPWTGV